MMKSLITQIKSRLHRLNDNYNSADNENGMALIIVVAIIAILSAIGVTFMYTMRMEEKAAFNYMNSLKASYIAKSGIEHAIAVLKSDGGDTGYDWYGEDWGYDTTLNPTAVFGGSEVDLDDTTVTTNLTAGNESKWIYLQDDNGDTVGRYAVLIVDESSKININTAGNISDKSYSPPRHKSNQGWHVSEIDLKALSPLITDAKADSIITYRWGGNYPGNPNYDHYGDSPIIQADGIDNNASGSPDDVDEWLENPKRFVPWRPYGSDFGIATSAGVGSLTDTSKTWGTNEWVDATIKIKSGTGAGQIRTITGNNSNTVWIDSNWGTNPNSSSFYHIGDDPFITIEEIKNVSEIVPGIFNNIKPYITVYSSDENTNASGFIRMNINLVKDAMALYTVMYDAWDSSYPDKDELRRLAAQAAVNAIDYTDTDNVSTFLEIDDGIDKKIIARGVEAIRFNEVMVKPAYQWEAEDLFADELVSVGTPGWHDKDHPDTEIYSITPSETIDATMELKRPGFYRVRVLTYSTAPYIGTVNTADNIPNPFLTVTGSPWTVNEWEGAIVTIFAGTGKGQTRRVVSNMVDTLYIDPSQLWTTIPANNDKFSLTKDHTFSVYIHKGGDDILEDTAGAHNIGGWLLEDLGVVEVEAGEYTIELKTSANLNTIVNPIKAEAPGARLDYIQLSQQPDCEYVELVNISDREIDISEWVLETSGGWAGTIPKDTIIGKKDYMVLVVDKEDNVAGLRPNNICFKNTWGDFDNVVQLALSTPPVNIAENVFGDTIVLPGSIFADSPIEIPVSWEDSGTYTTVTNSTLTVSGAPWVTNQWKGATITANIHCDFDSQDTQITRQVASNTSNEITLTTKWDWRGSVANAINPYYYIFFTPMAITLYKGLLANQEIVAQVDYSASDVNRVCYIQNEGTPD